MSSYSHLARLLGYKLQEERLHELACHKRFPDTLGPILRQLTDRLSQQVLRHNELQKARDPISLLTSLATLLDSIERTGQVCTDVLDAFGSPPSETTKEAAFPQLLLVRHMLRTEHGGAVSGPDAKLYPPLRACHKESTGGAAMTTTTTTAAGTTTTHISLSSASLTDIVTAVPPAASEVATETMCRAETTTLSDVPLYDSNLAEENLRNDAKHRQSSIPVAVPRLPLEVLASRYGGGTTTNNSKIPLHKLKAELPPKLKSQPVGTAIYTKKDVLARIPAPTPLASSQPDIVARPLRQSATVLRSYVPRADLAASSSTYAFPYYRAPAAASTSVQHGSAVAAPPVWAVPHQAHPAPMVFQQQQQQYPVRPVLRCSVASQKVCFPRRP